MSIATYAELQTAIASWHHRSVSEITDFITLAEKRINALLRSRFQELESTLTATIGSRYIALPTGFQEVTGLWLTTYGNRITIHYKVPEEMPVIDTSNGQPYYYTIDGTNLAFDYPASQAFTFVIRYKKGLSIATTSTNDVLTNHPSVYLYGAMREASILSEDDRNAEKYEALFQQAIEETMRTMNKNKAYAEISQDTAVVGNRLTNIIVGDI